MRTMPVNYLAERLRARTAGLASRPGANRLDVHLDVVGPVPIARFVGELDGDNAVALEHLADDLVTQGGTTLVLDLRQLFSVDLTGLITLRDTAALLRERGGQLALAGLRPRVRYFLARTGTAEQFATYRSVEDAVRAGDGNTPEGLSRAVADLRQPVDPVTRPVVPALVSAITRR
jgi:anti-sigma B factor antagonist